MKRVGLLLGLCVVIALTISGCGGGGGNRGSLSGTVTDVAGNLVPGANILVDGRSTTKSLMNGTYKIPSLSPGSHNIEAQATIDGKTWVGTRALDVYNDGPTMNMNIIMGAYNTLGDIKGSVTDLSNHPLSGARVIAVARYPQPESGTPADEASVVSKVAITDGNGAYEILDLPDSIMVNGEEEELIYDVIASYAWESGQPGGFENVVQTATVGGNMETTLNFKLEASTIVTPPVPAAWTDPDAIYVISYTVPKAITSRATANAYDAVKSCISEKSSKAIAYKRKHNTRSAPAGTVIENNVIWYSIWNAEYDIDPPSNLAGFAIYRSSTSDMDRSDRYRIDFFRDPSIVSYADTSGQLSAGITYWYGVTAIGTSYLDQYDRFNPDAESELCYPASVTPLGKLTAVLPANNAQVSRSNANFQWSRASGARSYRVYIYNDYPILDGMFTPQGDPARPDHLPGWGQSDVVTGTSVLFDDPDFSLESGHTYWWVVLASDANNFEDGNAFAISELRSFTVR
jgi:hypothetical protein